jgi:hypothetical protein
MGEINTSNDLRVILAEEIQKIRAGETTAANVNAIVNATGKILTTVKMEIEYSKLIGKTPIIDFIKGSSQVSGEGGKTT